MFGCGVPRKAMSLVYQISIVFDRTEVRTILQFRPKYFSWPISFKSLSITNGVAEGTIYQIEYGKSLTEITAPYELDFKKLDIGSNYSQFIANSVYYYEFPYPLGTDVYISDVGVYFPSQYTNKLNNQYEGLVYYQALSRQVSHNNVHINVQNLNRAWDKIREQSDMYIRCIWCKILFGIVFQKVIVYDKYQSCLDRVGVCRVKKPNIFMTKNARLERELYIDKFENSYGKIKSMFLILVSLIFA